MSLHCLSAFSIATIASYFSWVTNWIKLSQLAGSSASSKITKNVFHENHRIFTQILGVKLLSGGFGNEKSVNLQISPSNPISLTWKSEILWIKIEKYWKNLELKEKWNEIKFLTDLMNFITKILIKKNKLSSKIFQV